MPIPHPARLAPPALQPPVTRWKSSPATAPPSVTTCGIRRVRRSCAGNARQNETNDLPFAHLSSCLLLLVFVSPSFAYIGGGTRSPGRSRSMPVRGLHAILQWGKRDHPCERDNPRRQRVFDQILPVLIGREPTRPPSCAGPLATCHSRPNLPAFAARRSFGHHGIAASGLVKCPATLPPTAINASTVASVIIPTSSAYSIEVLAVVFLRQPRQPGVHRL